MAKKKKVNRLNDLAATHEYVRKHPFNISASYWHRNGEDWYEFCISGFGITYKKVKLNEIPDDAIIVSKGYYEKETKELRQMMKDLVDNAKSLEETVKQAEKEERDAKK
jgi:hypothetical protein